MTDWAERRRIAIEAWELGKRIMVLGRYSCAPRSGRRNCSTVQVPATCCRSLTFPHRSHRRTSAVYGIRWPHEVSM